MAMPLLATAVGLLAGLLGLGGGDSVLRFRVLLQLVCCGEGGGGCGVGGNGLTDCTVPQWRFVEDVQLTCPSKLRARPAPFSGVSPVGAYRIWRVFGFAVERSQVPSTSEMVCPSACNLPRTP